MEKEKTEMDCQKILLDTDIGDDIDDVLALALGLSLPEVEFVGITTVFRDTVMRARLAKKLTLDAGFEVPIYAGNGDGLNVVHEKVGLNQYTPELDDEKYAPNNHETSDGDEAVDFIIECCKKYGKELIVLAIGPLTNIAKAIQKAPGIFDGIKKVVMMGGAYFLHHSEWNILWDVDAAEIVYAGVRNLECIGWDITTQVQFTQAETEYVLNFQDDGYRGYVARLVKLWVKNHSYLPILHDPLALYYAIYPEICTMRKAKIRVLKDEGLLKGFTLNLMNYDDCREKKETLEVLVADSVDSKKMIRIFLNKVFLADDF